jgi:uncharacterized protein YlxP (DUF503 family)
MVVGVMQVQIAIDWSQSLKDKRRVVKSLRDTLHRHHMVSVSEVEDQEVWNRATLGIAMAGSSGSAVGATLDRVLDRIRSVHDCELTGTSREVLHGWGASFAGALGHEQHEQHDEHHAQTDQPNPEDKLAFNRAMETRGTEALQSQEPLRDHA